MPIPNMLGKGFPTLAQRVYYSYIATYPVFKPLPGISEASQRDMYDFMAHTLKVIYEQPSIVGAAEEPDDCYTGWALNNSKPELIKAMEKIEAKFVSFIESLIQTGKRGAVEDDSFIIHKTDMTVSKALRQRLEAVGIAVSQDKTGAVLRCPDYPKLFPAWRAYSLFDNEGDQKVTRAITFIHARYEGKTNRATEFFSGLISDTSRMEALESFFEERGFTLSNFDIGNKTRFAYVKWLKEFPDKETASMRVSFNWRKDKQLIYEFRLPRFRLMLNDYGDMDDDMKAFIFSRLKTCDNCGYCTQTDKSGKRKRLAMPLVSRGDAADKCPLFPWFTWTELSSNDMDEMLRLFTLALTRMENKA